MNDIENPIHKVQLFAQSHDLEFNNWELLAQSFTHRSYVNENPGVPWTHNERLEFLGDAVLELIITRYLFEKYPNQPEGELTAYRAALVNTKSLAEAAVDNNMGDYLLLSRGEAKDDNGRAREHILANTFEAVLGAIYLDIGYDGAKSFVAKILYKRIDAIVEEGSHKDPKSRVQEWAQEHRGVTPTYKVIRDDGPDHDKTFVVGIYFDSEEISTGEGRSKQEAQQNAAISALEVVDKPEEKISSDLL